MNIRLDPFRVFHWRLILTSTLCSRVISNVNELYKLESGLRGLYGKRDKESIRGSSKRIDKALELLESIAYDADTILVREDKDLERMIKKIHKYTEKRIKKEKGRKATPEQEKKMGEIKKAGEQLEGNVGALIKKINRLFYELWEESKQLETGVINQSLVKELDVRNDARLMILIKRNIIEVAGLEKQLDSLKGKIKNCNNIIKAAGKELDDLYKAERFDKKLIHRLKEHLYDTAREAAKEESLKELRGEIYQRKNRFNTILKKIKTQELRAYSATK